MRPKQINIDLDAVDPNGLFEDQTLAGAGTFTLNGAGVTGGEWVSPDGFAKQIGFESTGNISGVTFTVAGYADPYRAISISEDVTGPNNSTVETTNYFAIVTSVTASGAVGTNTEAGPVDEAEVIVPLNWRGGGIALGLEVTGTINYSVQHTFDPLTQAEHPFTWLDNDDTSIVSATASATGNYLVIPRAVRFLINSYSTGAALKATVMQSDV